MSNPATRVWRIGLSVALLVGIGIAVLFGYQVFWLDNARVVENLSSLQPNPILGFIVFEALIATFLVGLITFPYYFFNAIGGFLDGRSTVEIKSFFSGFAASIICVLLALWLAFSFLDLDGGKI